MASLSIIRAGILVAASVIVILIGQAGRELLPPDDLREVEVAREMLERGDLVVPHLAGLPFVEKPSGFPAMVAGAYWIVGGPDATAARFVSAAFALAALTAVFLLGRRVMGLEGAALAVAVLSLSMRFCRTAHQVLLDNALTAASAFAFFFMWSALSAETLKTKRLAYAGAGFSLGIAFLMKGFVGPLLFGAGFLVYLAASRRFTELRQIFGPLPVIAFLIPLLLWLIPFIRHASPDLLKAFFIDNHFGRAAYGFASRTRPFYFYLVNIWQAFAPSSMFLPFAVVTAWKRRNIQDGKAALFFLAAASGSITLLSMSRAKDSVYLLPAYPVIALLVAWAIERAWKEPGTWTRMAGILAAAAAVLCSAVAVAATAALGGALSLIVPASMVLISFMIACMRALQKGDLRWAGAWTIVIFALGWVHWFTGPIAQYEISKVSDRPALEQMIRAAGDRDLLLYRPKDGLRGGFGFYRNRTAQEVRFPESLVAGLMEQPQPMAVLIRQKDDEPIPIEIMDAAEAAGVKLQVESTVSYDELRRLVLIKAGIG